MRSSRLNFVYRVSRRSIREDEKVPEAQHWEITEACLDSLGASRPWKVWREAWEKAGQASEFTPQSIYGPDGRMPQFNGQQWASAADMRAALCTNMGGGVPIEIIEELVRLSAVPDPDREQVAGADVRRFGGGGGVVRMPPTTPR